MSTSNLCVLVLWEKVALALEGLTLYTVLYKQVVSRAHCSLNATIFNTVYCVCFFRQPVEGNKALHVSNLPIGCVNQDLYSVFKNYGRCTIRVIAEKCIAFVVSGILDEYLGGLEANTSRV